jgi:hypothetical protein
MKSATVSKQRFLLLAIVIFACQTLTSAQTLKDVFSNSETPLLYLGIDYSKAKLIEDATASVNDIRDRQYPAINDLVITEAKKYDLKGAFHKSNVDHDLSAVTKRNEKINTEDIKSSNTGDYHRLKESDIDDEVRSMDFGDKKGVGLVFIVEAMNKTGKGAAVWVTLLDMKGKKVLLTERLEGKTGMGFGFRNFWAIPIKNVIDEIDSKKYKEWKAKYGS